MQLVSATTALGLIAVSTFPIYFEDTNLDCTNP